MRKGEEEIIAYTLLRLRAGKDQNRNGFPWYGSLLNVLVGFQLMLQWGLLSYVVM